MGVTAYLDEANTHAGSARVLVGAAVTLSGETLEAAVEQRKRQIYTEGSYWSQTPEKREPFGTRGFHHCDDDDTVRSMFVESLSGLDFRSHVCFSRRSVDLPDEDLLLVMYHILVRNLARRYAGLRLDLIFEENSALDRHYGGIVRHALTELVRQDSPLADVAARIGAKPLGGLSVIDYVLAITNDRIATEDQAADRPRFPFRISRFDAIGRHMAHVIDFDTAAHRRRWARLL